MATSAGPTSGRHSTTGAVAVSVPRDALANDDGDDDDRPLLGGGGKGSRSTYFSRWVVLSVAMATAYATGSAYDFGLYSDELQSNLSYSESEITLLASFANAGLYSMIVSGLCLEFVGPRYNLLIGGLLSSIGYLFLWSIATLMLDSTIVGSVLSLYLATFGTSFFSITCTTLIVANFPARDRGKAVGIMKAFLGLGISINSQFYTTFFGDLDYLLGLAIVLPLVALIGASVVNYVPRRDLEYSGDEAPNNGRANFWIWFLLIGGTAVWVGLATYLDAELTMQQWGNDLLFLPTVLLTLLGLAWFPFQYGPLKRRVVLALDPSEDENAALIEKPATAPPPPPTTTELGGGGGGRLLVGEEGRAGQEDNDFTLLQMLSTVEFWLLFFIFSMGAGVCLTVVNNIAGIMDAFSSTEGTAVPLMLFGIFETAGRLSVALSDIFGSSVARVFLLDAVLVVLFLCCLLLAYANIYTLNLCVILVSYCYGFLYADMSAITADLFGVRHFGGNLGFSLFAPIIGSFAFASGVVDIFYTEGCTGSLCYRYVFLTEAVTCLIATVLCLFLKLRIMDRYQVTTLAEIFRHRRRS